MKEITKEIAKDLLKNACDFQDISLKSRNEVRGTYKKKEKSEENTLRILIDGLIAKIAKEQTVKKTPKTNEKISYQISLLASFIRTHFLISDLFMQGDLIETITLIRKQLESLVRMHEIDEKPLMRLYRKTPNVCNIFKSSGKKIYPKLSEVAHFGTPEVGELLKVVETGDLIGPSLIPIYHDYSLACLDLNCFVAIHFLYWLIEKQIEFHDDFDGILEKQIFYDILHLAIKLDVIRLPEEETLKKV